MPTIKKPLLMAQKLIIGSVSPGDTVVDATAGNGNDTLFLARLVGEGGKVYSFDIQREAILRTTDRLLDAGLLSRVRLICSGHEEIAGYVRESVSAVMFNLGYLPGKDHSLVTKAETTLPALETSLERLNPGGVITIMLYSGHPGGEEEKGKVLHYCSMLNQDFFDVLLYETINWSNHPPVLVAIEKKMRRINE